MRFFLFLMKACITMNFPLRTAFAVSHRFCMVVFTLSRKEVAGALDHSWCLGKCVSGPRPVLSGRELVEAHNDSWVWAGAGAVPQPLLGSGRVLVGA